jgi:hypothetical protein
MADMRLIRNRARLTAVLALMWHVLAVAAVSTALSCDPNAASEHAGMLDCPLHDKAPVCPLHAERHGTHECDCPTIGCAETDTGLMTLLSAVGILADASEMLILVDAGHTSKMTAESLNSLAPVPLAPPPRA